MAKKEVKTNKTQKRHFFKDMKAELKKVIWPTAKQTTNNTMAVIGFTLILAAIVFVLDLGFDFVNKKGVVTLQEKVKSSFSSNTTEESAESEESSSSEEGSEENATDVEAETSTEETTKTEKESKK